MRRVVTPELLDNDVGAPQEVATSLADLRRINRWFGGVSTTVDMVRRVARLTGQSSFSVLDVGAGAGDSILDAQHKLQHESIKLRLTLLDRKHSHLALSSDQRNGLPRRIAGNALAIPLTDKSVDLVTCGLFAHHLEPDELVLFVNEALRVCRMAVLINDLRRSAISLGLVYAGFPLMRSHLSRYDGVASVRRAYLIPEMQTMLARTHADHVEISPHYLFRMGAMAWKAA